MTQTNHSSTIAERYALLTRCIADGTATPDDVDNLIISFRRHTAADLTPAEIARKVQTTQAARAARLADMRRGPAPRLAPQRPAVDGTCQLCHGPAGSYPTKTKRARRWHLTCTVCQFLRHRDSRPVRTRAQMAAAIDLAGLPPTTAVFADGAYLPAEWSDATSGLVTEPRPMGNAEAARLIPRYRGDDGEWHDAEYVDRGTRSTRHPDQDAYDRSEPELADEYVPEPWLADARREELARYSARVRRMGTTMRPGETYLDSYGRPFKYLRA